MPFRIHNRLWHVIRDFDHEYTEFMLGLFKTLIGFWYLMPWDSLASAQGSRFFAELAPEPVWGVVFLGFGLSQLYLVLHGQSYGPRSRIAMAGIAMWTIFTVLSVIGNWKGAGWTITLVFVLSNIVIYLRLKNISDYVNYKSSTRVPK